MEKIDLFSIDKEYFQTIEPLNNRYPCVFIPGVSSYNPLNFYVNPSYWGFNSDVETIEQNNNYIFTNIGFYESAHDSACKIFAQIYGGYADYGEEHSKKYGHSRYGKYFYPSKLSIWNEERPIIIVCHSHGAQISQALQYLLAIDFWKKGTNSKWIKSIITINGAINGSQLSLLPGTTYTDEGLIISPFIKIFGIMTVNVGYLLPFVSLLLMYIAKKIGIINYIVSLIDPFEIDNFVDIFTLKNTMFSSQDCNLFELSFEGSKKFQEKYIIQDPNTIYLNFMTHTNITRYIPNIFWSPLLSLTNFIISLYGTPDEFLNKNIPFRYSYLNDGAVTMMSQSYPYLNNKNFKNNELSLLDIDEQYSLLKFRSEQISATDIIKTGVYYYIDFNENVNNHLKYVMLGGFLPLNDIFYRSIVDFVRQYIRRLEVLEKLEIYNKMQQDQVANDTENFNLWQQTFNGTIEANTNVTNILNQNFLFCDAITTNGQIISDKITSINNDLQTKFSDLNNQYINNLNNKLVSINSNNIEILQKVSDYSNILDSITETNNNIINTMSSSISNNNINQNTLEIQNQLILFGQNIQDINSKITLTDNKIISLDQKLTDINNNNLSPSSTIQQNLITQTNNLTNSINNINTKLTGSVIDINVFSVTTLRESYNSLVSSINSISTEIQINLQLYVGTNKITNDYIIPGIQNAISTTDYNNLINNIIPSIILLKNSEYNNRYTTIINAINTKKTSLNLLITNFENNPLTFDSQDYFDTLNQINDLFLELIAGKFCYPINPDVQNNQDQTIIPYQNANINSTLRYTFDYNNVSAIETDINNIIFDAERDQFSNFKELMTRYLGDALIDIYHDVVLRKIFISISGATDNEKVNLYKNVIKKDYPKLRLIAKSIFDYTDLQIVLQKNIYTPYIASSYKLTFDCFNFLGNYFVTVNDTEILTDVSASYNFFINEYLKIIINSFVKYYNAKILWRYTENPYPGFYIPNKTNPNPPLSLTYAQIFGDFVNNRALYSSQYNRSIISYRGSKLNGGNLDFDYDFVLARFTDLYGSLENISPSYPQPNDLINLGIV